MNDGMGNRFNYTSPPAVEQVKNDADSGWFPDSYDDSRVAHILDLAYEAARENARYWSSSDLDAKPWAESETYASLKRAVTLLSQSGGTAPNDGVFTVKNGEWRARFNGVVQAAVWADYESAAAAWGRWREDLGR